MKRSWLFALLLAGSLVSLYTPAFADEDATEDINQAIGAIKSSVGDLSKLVSSIGLYGDVRFKEGWYTQSSANPNAQILDVDKTQIRARLGIKKTFGDVEANLRLVTDAASNYPSSNTPTLGDGLDDQVAYFDLASVTWTPSFLDKHVVLTGGKFVNNLDYTPITWDETLTLDGASVAFKTDNTRLVTDFIEFAENPAATGGSLVVAPGNGQQVFIWTTQLSQDFKLDQDNLIHAEVGYEYIPNVTWLNTTGDFIWNGATKGVANYGNIVTNANGANYIPDFNVGELLLQYKGKLFADVPWKWTLDITDNFGSFNLPNAYLQNTTPSNANNSLSNLENNMGYWLSVDLGASSTQPAKDAFGGQLAIAYLDPNAQLDVLTDHDANFTNEEYFRGILSFGVNDNFALQYKTWVEYHVYYEPGIGNVGTSLTSANGASQTAYWTNFFYATVSF